MGCVASMKENMREDFKRALEKLKSYKAKRVFVQYPEGIKLRIQKIAKDIEDAGYEVVVCTEPCFGACDIRDFEAARLGCDTILHIGHEEFVPQSEIMLPVIYWEYFIDVDPLPILKDEKQFSKLGRYKRIGLVTSIQFVHALPKVKEFLEKAGKETYVHKSLQYPGQVLGCNLDAAIEIEDKLDCFLCISAGKFYGWGLTIFTEKPVLCLDLERKEIFSLDDLKKKILKIIAWNKAQFKDARNIAILVSWKKGQIKSGVFDIKKKLEKLGKNVYILAMDEITPEKLMGLDVDFLVNCACPRIGVDDISRYKIPILNFEEILKLID